MVHPHAARTGRAGPGGYTAADLDTSPFIVFYEVTRACDLVCKHCRACAQPKPHSNELSSENARALLGQLAEFPHKPLVVLSGGDPLKRSDIVDLLEHGTSLGLSMSMSPACTSLCTRTMMQQLKDAGLQRMAVSLDGADAATHDAFRGVEGSFDQAIRMIREARDIGLAVQVNTTVARHNVHQIDALAQLLDGSGIVLWSVFFLVPVGRGLREQRLAPPQYDQVFEKLFQHSQNRSFAIKTTEAPFYRRFVLQRHGDPQLGPHRAPLGINDGKGVMFISHVGDVQPSGFLAKRCGRFPAESVIDIYQKNPVFQALRDPDRLGGKCGRCEFRKVCGGSRARSFALTRDYLAEEPDCVYVPAGG